MQNPELIQALDTIRKNLEEKNYNIAQSNLKVLISRTEGTVKARLLGINNLDTQQPVGAVTKAIDAFIIDLEG